MRVILALRRAWAVSNPKSDATVGGSFTDVRRSAYGRTPTFSWLRLEIGDDIVFGQMMKHSGARRAVYNAPDDVRLCFYPMLRPARRCSATAAAAEALAHDDLGPRGPGCRAGGAARRWPS